MHIKPLDYSNMFSISTKSNGKLSLLQAIGIILGQIITHKRFIIPEIDENNRVIADAQIDMAKLAVIERQHRTGHFGLGFVQGLDLKIGSLASSVAHDSHNLVVAGMNDMDMLIAAKHVSLIGGDLAVVNNNKIVAKLPFPIAGLISNQSIVPVISNLMAVNKDCRKLGENVEIHLCYFLLSHYLL
jgi:adenine deaminase